GGTTLASGDGLGAIGVWGPATGRTRLRIPGDDVAVFAAAFSPDDRTLVTGGNSRALSLWDAASGQRRKLQGQTERISSLAFAPDGKTLATASWDRSIWLWDAVSYQPRAVFVPRYYYLVV